MASTATTAVWTGGDKAEEPKTQGRRFNFGVSGRRAKKEQKRNERDDHQRDETTAANGVVSETSGSSSPTASGVSDNSASDKSDAPILVKENGLEKACVLVKAILDQVTLGDSPPTNEEEDEEGDSPPASGEGVVVAGTGTKRTSTGIQEKSSPNSLRTNSSASTLTNSTNSGGLSPTGKITSGEHQYTDGKKSITGPTSRLGEPGKTTRYSRQRHVVPPHPADYGPPPPPPSSTTASSPNSTVQTINTSTGSSSPQHDGSSVPFGLPISPQSVGSETTYSNNDPLSPASPTSTPPISPGNFSLASSVASSTISAYSKGSSAKSAGSPPHSPRPVHAMAPGDGSSVGDGTVRSVGDGEGEVDAPSGQIFSAVPSVSGSSSFDLPSPMNSTASSPTGAAASTASDGVATTPLKDNTAASMLLTAHYGSSYATNRQKRMTKSEMTMGNVALASLCARTLDSVVGTAHASSAAARAQAVSQKSAFESSDGVEGGKGNVNEPDGAATIAAETVPSDPGPPEPPHVDSDATPKRGWLSRKLGLNKKKDASDDDGVDGEPPHINTLHPDDEVGIGRVKSEEEVKDKEIERRARMALKKEKTGAVAIDSNGAEISKPDEVLFPEDAMGGAGSSAATEKNSAAGPGPVTRLCPDETVAMLDDCVQAIFKADSEESNDYDGQQQEKEGTETENGEKEGTVPADALPASTLPANTVGLVSHRRPDGGKIIKEGMDVIEEGTDDGDATEEAESDEVRSLFISSSSESDAGASGLKQGQTESSACGGGIVGQDAGILREDVFRETNMSTLEAPRIETPKRGKSDFSGGNQSSVVSSSAPPTQNTSEPVLVATQAHRPPMGATSTASKPVTSLPVHPKSPRKRRIQMFGSEYARHLSSTPLSPPVPRARNNRSKLKSAFSRKPGGTNVAAANQYQPLSTPSVPVNTSSSSSFRSHYHPLNLEDASDAILTGAITDILVTHGSEIPPKGYYRISQTGDGDDFDTLQRNAGGGGVTGIVPGRKLTRVYINVKKEANWDRAVQRPCVTALALIYPDRNEFVPPGFCVVRRYKSRSATQEGVGKGKGEKENSSLAGSPAVSGGGANGTIPANLNFGTSGERVYLCYRRSREGNPITGIIPLQPSRNEPIPEGYTVLERTPRNYVADMNSKSGPALFLAFRQRLSNLEPLRPLPLVLSVYYANQFGEDRSVDSNSVPSRRGSRLAAYYCTGGTVVPSEVGRFHIMDRSTHPLLSPSSVTNRLSLIQASRLQRAGGSIGPGSPNNSMPGTPISSASSYASSAYASSTYASSHPRSPMTPSNHRNLSRTKKGSKTPHVSSSTSRDRPPSPTKRMKRVLSKSAQRLSVIDAPRPDPYSALGHASEGALHSHGLGEADSVVSSTSSDLLGSLIQQQQSHQLAQFALTNSSFDSSNGTTTAISTNQGSIPHSPSVSSYGSTLGASSGAGDGYGSFSGGGAASTTSSLGSSVVPISAHPDEKEHQQRTSRQSLFTHDDNMLQSCFDAMDFIPPIEVAALPDEEKDVINAVLLLQARVAVITPILTACYTHHGGSALVAVEGLSSLLNETDFFKPDVSPDDGVKGRNALGTGSSTRLTLLDLATQVVCDVATSTSRETSFGPCVDFVCDAVRFAGASLNTRTIGYALRFYLFVFYFGASVPTSSSWPNTTRPTSPREKTGGGIGFVDEASDVLLLFEEPRKAGVNRSGVYMPGGAPQKAALALKDLLSLLLVRLCKLSSTERAEVVAVASSPENEVGEAEELGQFVQSILSTVIDGAVHRVDVANFTQLALHQIHRSGGSELFWHDMMTSCGVGLFGNDESLSRDARHGYMIAFAVLANVVKVASGKVRRVAQTVELVPRDVASKLLSWELLLHFLEQWRCIVCNTGNLGVRSTEKRRSEKKSRKQMESPSVETMVYTIRRLLIPCLLSNTGSGLEDSRVFRRMIRVVSELWRSHHYRHLMKMELGMLIEHFVVKMLQLGPQVLPPTRLHELENKENRRGSSSALLEDITSPLLSQQIDVLNEVKRWYASDPIDALELFLNFDMEDTTQIHARMLPGAQWKISQQLCSALCTLAEQCGDIISEQVRISGAGPSSSGGPSSTAVVAHNAPYPATIARGEDTNEMATVREGARLLQEKSFDAICQIVKSLMECAALASGEKMHSLISPPPAPAEPGSASGTIRGFVPIAEGGSEDDDEEDILSVSTTSSKPSPRGVGGWKHGFRRNNDVPSPPTASGESSSPRRHHMSPIRTSAPLPVSPRRMASPTSSGGIVDYWLHSVAERRKASSSPAPDQRNKVGNLTPSEMGAQSKENAPTSTKPKRRGHGSDGRPFFPPLSPRRGSNVHSKAGGRSSQPSESMPMEISFSTASTDPPSPSKQKTEETINVAFEIMVTKSLKKALEYLIACNILSPSPRDVASFLRIHQARLDPTVLGEYLGEGGKDGAEVEYWNLIRFNYVRAISFVGMNVEQGLRHFLTNCGFRLPGEAQRIDRIITTFAQCYWEDNAGDHVRCPFHDQDTVFLISFAIIMLNTDLHKSSSTSISHSNAGSSRKQRKKMTRAEFLNNLRGVDSSESLSRDYLSAIYDSIEAHPIAIYHHPEERISGGASVRSGLSLSTSGKRLGYGIDNGDLSALVKSLIKNVKPAQEILRGLAVHEHRFLTLSDYDRVSKGRVPKELVRTAVGATWHHFHGIVNATLDNAHLDPNGMESCLDVLNYVLCATICLDMAMERSAFITQLARVKFFKESRGLNDISSNNQRRVPSLVTAQHQDHQAYKNDEWYRQLAEALGDPSNDKAKSSALDQVTHMIKDLHSSIQIDSKLKKDMNRIARRIRNGEILLNDPTRSFLREGDLVKKCNRSGRNVTYRFFLFSDMLVYAHKSSSSAGDYKIHEELPLHLMKIVDPASDNSPTSKKQQRQRSFLVQHPRKTFLVLAPTKEDKMSWVQDISSAMEKDFERKANLEAARLASAAVER